MSLLHPMLLKSLEQAFSLKRRSRITIKKSLRGSQINLIKGRKFKLKIGLLKMPWRRRFNILLALLVLVTSPLFYFLYPQLLASWILLILLAGAMVLGYYFLKFHFTQLRLVAIFVLQVMLSILLLSLIPQRILIMSIIVTLIAFFVIYSRLLYEFLRRRYA
jgi:hypothetical protein